MVTEARQSGSEGTPAFSNVRRSGAPTATATGCRPLFRSAAVTGFGDLALDADNRKDQYGSEAFAWRAIHGRARPSRSRIRRKFNDGAHVPFSLVATKSVIWPATCHYSEQNVVNGILICEGGTVKGSRPYCIRFYGISSGAVFLNQPLKRPA